MGFAACGGSASEFERRSSTAHCIRCAISTRTTMPDRRSSDFYGNAFTAGGFMYSDVEITGDIWRLVDRVPYIASKFACVVPLWSRPWSSVRSTTADRGSDAARHRSESAGAAQAAVSGGDLFAEDARSPHFKAFAPNPQAVAGLAFWTTEIEPLERGYDGPIKILVGMDTKGVLTGVIVAGHNEPYGDFSVDRPSSRRSSKARAFAIRSASAPTSMPCREPPSPSPARRAR